MEDVVIEQAQSDVCLGEIRSHFGASEATIFSKRGSPRTGSQTGNMNKTCPISNLTSDGALSGIRRFVI